MRIPTVVLFVFIMFAARRTNAQVTGLGTNNDGSYLNTEQAQTPLSTLSWKTRLLRLTTP